MSNHIDPTGTLRAMIDALGLSPAQLADVVESLGTGSTVPTVLEFLPEAQEACPEPSRATYGTHFRRLAETEEALLTRAIPLSAVLPRITRSGVPGRRGGADLPHIDGRTGSSAGDRRGAGWPREAGCRGSTVGRWL